MGAPLPLYPGAKPCVGSGLCCRTGVCGFGTWDEQKHQCRELLENNDGTTACRRYDEILALPESQWAMSPAFGGGCCMPLFNTAREIILRRKL
jgi:hypothetical protein